MNTKWSVVLTVICIGTFATSGALLVTGQHSGNTSGTILNPERRGDALIFPYYDVRQITECVESSTIGKDDKHGWNICPQLSMSGSSIQGNSQGRLQREK